MIISPSGLALPGSKVPSTLPLPAPNGIISSGCTATTVASATVVAATQSAVGAVASATIGATVYVAPMQAQVSQTATSADGLPILVPDGARGAQDVTFHLAPAHRGGRGAQTASKTHPRVDGEEQEEIENENNSVDKQERKKRRLLQNAKSQRNFRQRKAEQEAQSTAELAELRAVVGKLQLQVHIRDEQRMQMDARMKKVEALNDALMQTLLKVKSGQMHPSQIYIPETIAACNMDIPAVATVPQQAEDTPSVLRSGSPSSTQTSSTGQTSLDATWQSEAPLRRGEKELLAPATATPSVFASPLPLIQGSEASSIPTSVSAAMDHDIMAWLNMQGVPADNLSSQQEAVESTNNNNGEDQLAGIMPGLQATHSWSSMAAAAPAQEYAANSNALSTSTPWIDFSISDLAPLGVPPACATESSSRQDVPKEVGQENATQDTRTADEIEMEELFNLVESGEDYVLNVPAPAESLAQSNNDTTASAPSSTPAMQLLGEHELTTLDLQSLLLLASGVNDQN